MFVAENDDDRNATVRRLFLHTYGVLIKRIERKSVVKSARRLAEDDHIVTAENDGTLRSIDRRYFLQGAEHSQPVRSFAERSRAAHPMTLIFPASVLRPHLHLCPG